MESQHIADAIGRLDSTMANVNNTLTKLDGTMDSVKANGVMEANIKHVNDNLHYLRTAWDQHLVRSEKQETERRKEDGKIYSEIANLKIKLAQYGVGVTILSVMFAAGVSALMRAWIG